ncbi:CoA transferase [Pseudonocardia sp. KRD-184]|uniref:CoA transferase n=1 Tax=Pseudonocardia oceani TaxID=2792013 RepID=A0ABS6U4T8_9PSEU|nr:CoA transferase [Pseudonocardia oceani]MBW0099314.1 CoA transferase [Pseudonocardia oceani]MBW0125440.1 CoA transferase [Pseudonocardia oceani]MBW0126914.1 CoA transferase [Pseudonocardia oceani]
MGVPETPAAPALDGIRVLELGTLIAGPFCGRLLADHGADVVKVEAPDRPDPLRDWGQAEVDGHHFFWTVHARGKRCVTLDLRRSRGQELFLRLVETADVVVESFRPGTLEKWGLGYDVLSGRNPRIVLARVSGYGQTGPHSGRPGYASVAEAVSGMRHLNGFPGGPPPRTALSIGDSLAGMFAAQGVLTALLARDRPGGRGQVVDVSLAESCLALLESTIPDHSATGHVRGPGGTRLDGLAPSNLYRCADDRWMVIAANQDTVFARLCTAMERPDLVDDARFATHTARGRHQDEIDAIVAAWAAERDADELTRVLEAAGVVVGPVNTVADVVRDPQFLARDMLLPHHDEALGRDVLGPGVVPRLEGTPGSVRWAGPARPGTHNTEVFGGLLGLTGAELDALAAERII